MKSEDSHVEIVYTSYDEDRLAKMLRLQQELQEIMPPKRWFPSNDPEVLMSQIRENVLSCTAELFEAIAETGWKPWASSNYVNYQAFRNEMVDAWHFFMNLMILGDMTADHLYDGYLAKRVINVQRQTDGYDGKMGKCPNCHRSYDDPGVKCRVALDDAPAKCMNVSS